MKKTIRRAMRVANLAIDENGRKNYANEIFSTIESSEVFRSAKVVAFYCDLPDEIPTKETIGRWCNDKKIVLPRVGEDYNMEFYEYLSPCGLASGAYGIDEPQSEVPFSTVDIDLMIVPGVAFTRAGVRLGRGKGFYDRYLAREGVRAYTIGVGYAHQIVEELPVEPHDMVLDMVISLP